MSTSRPLATSSATLSPEKIEQLEAQLAQNPYFLRFKDRITKLKETDPNTYIDRLQLMLDQTEKQKKQDAGEKYEWL